MHADNTAPIVVAARQRRELTRAKAIQALRELERTGTPVTFQSVAAAATVSRSWLYNQPAIRAEIERLRPLRRRHSPWPPAAATLTATGVPNTATRVVLVRIADQPESTGFGAYKAECIADDSPFRIGPLRTVSDVEEVASAWVHWYNTARMLHRLGRIPPTEYEAKYYAAAVRDSAVMI